MFEQDAVCVLVILIVARQLHLQAVDRIPTASKLGRINVVTAIEAQSGVPTAEREIAEIKLEIDFLTAVAEKTGCGLLLDVNNVMVSAVNHRLDPYAYLDRFPVERVGEVHLAGYDETVDGAGDRLLIDAHATTVKNDVFALYEHLLRRTGPLPTLVEWDNDVPDWPVLAAEAARAARLMATA